MRLILAEEEIGSDYLKESCICDSRLKDLSFYERKGVLVTFVYHFNTLVFLVRHTTSSGDVGCLDETMDVV